MASLIKLAAMPSLTQLYRSGQLVAYPKNSPYSGSQALNDKVCTIQHDITKLELDAIVNAANDRLLPGGGVCGAIFNAAGDGLEEACEELNGCKTGSAKVTDAFNLPCKKIIHAVGPIYYRYSSEEAEALLRSCYRTCLQLAADNSCQSIAFNALSTGIYGYPNRAAAFAAVDEVRKFLEQPAGDKIDKVVFCNFLDKDVAVYGEALP